MLAAFAIDVIARGIRKALDGGEDDDEAALLIEAGETIVGAAGVEQYQAYNTIVSFIEKHRQ